MDVLWRPTTMMTYRFRETQAAPQFEPIMSSPSSLGQIGTWGDAPRWIRFWDGDVTVGTLMRSSAAG
jgi:hypothetical protein